MKLGLLKIIFVFFAIPIFSQSDKANYIHKGQSTIYFELGGLSVKPFSINYDRVLFIVDDIYFSTSIGVGFIHKKTDGRFYSFPITFGLTTGANKKNHIEFGIGLTYSNEKYLNYYKTKTIYSEIIYVGFRIGYKYQADNPFFLRAGISPLKRLFVINDTEEEGFFGKDFGLILNMLIGISIGYTF